MNEPTPNIRQFVDGLLHGLKKSYLNGLYDFVKANPDAIDTIPGFLLDPEEIIFYLGPNHLAVEYVGNEHLRGLPLEFKPKIRYFDLSHTGEDFLNKIIGISYENSAFKIPAVDVMEDLVVPTDQAVDELVKQNWNWEAQNMFAPLHTGGLAAVTSEFARIVDGRFFGIKDHGLQTRHIKWLDLLPTTKTEVGEKDEYKTNLWGLINRVESDATTPYPSPISDYRYKHLPRLNRFIELIGTSAIRETQITDFLSQDQFSFILRMRFNSSEVLSQITCEWQSEPKSPIKPDFFIVGTSGYADILEFKLPYLKGSGVVGNSNRERFSAEISAYIAQTRVYSEYFDDPNNRRWVEEKYSIRVYKPKRILVLGRRWDFSSDEWRAIAQEHLGVHLMSYDELIEGVTMQFYQQ